MTRTAARAIILFRWRPKDQRLSLKQSAMPSTITEAIVPFRWSSLIHRLSFVQRATMPSTASTVKIPTPEDKTSRITRYDRQKLSILRLSVVNSRQEYADMEHAQACDAKETQPHHRHSICGPPNLKTAVRAGECFVCSGSVARLRSLLPETLNALIWSVAQLRSLLRA